MKIRDLVPSQEGVQDLIGRSRRLQKIVQKTLTVTFQLGRAKTPAQARVHLQSWGESLCKYAKIKTEVEGTPFVAEPCLYVSNHVSYMDIPILISMLPLTFVAKKEVHGYPVFGPGATAAGTVFVDRESTKSRSEVAKIIGRAIVEDKKSIGIFPEGTSAMKVMPWKRGAFKIAQEFGFKVQPIRIHYSPLRPCAYIEEDTLLPHLWGVLGLESGVRAAVKFYDPVLIQDAELDAARIEEMIRASFNQKVSES